MEDGQSSSPLPFILNTKELHSNFSGVSTSLSSNTSCFDASPQSNVSVMGVYSKVVSNLKDKIFGLQHELSTVENLDLNNAKLHVKTDNLALTIPSQLSASIDTESADLKPDIEFINNPLTTQVLSLNNAYSVDHLPKNDPLPHGLNLSNALSPSTLSDLASFISGSAKVHSVNEPSSVPTSKPVIVTQGPMKMTTKLVSFTHELQFLSPYTYMRISPSELGESPRELSNSGITGIHSNSSNDRSTSSKIERPNSEMFPLSKSVSTTSETNSSTNDFQSSTSEPKFTTSKLNYSNFELKSSTLENKSFISEPKSSTFSPTSETKFSSELKFAASEPKSSTSSPKSSTSESKSSIYEPNSSNFKTVSSTVDLKSPTAEKKPPTFEPEFSTTELVTSTSEHESFTTGIVTATSEPALFTAQPVLYYETESFQFEPILPTYQAEPFSNDKLVTATPDLEFSPFDRLFTSTNSELVPSGTMLFTSEQVSSTDVTIPPTSEPVPSTNAPIPPTSEAVPSIYDPIPPTSEPVPSNYAPIPPTSEPVPSTSAPIPTTSGHVLVTQQQLPIPKSELKSILSNSVTSTSEKVSESSPASIATLESESSSESVPINSDPGFISHEQGTNSNFLDSPVKNILEQDYSEPDILLVDGLITKDSLEHNVDVTSVTELEVGNPGEYSVSNRLRNLNRMTTQKPLLNSSDSSATGVNNLLNFDSVGYMDNDARRIDGKFHFHNSLPMSNLAFYSILLTSLSLAAVLLMVIFAFAYRRRSMKRKLNLSHVKVPSHCDVSFENEFLRPPSSSWTCTPSGKIDFQDSLLTKSLPPAILPAEIDSIYMDQNLSRAYTNFAFDSGEETCHDAARVYSLNRSVVQSADDITSTSVEQLSGSQQGTVSKDPSYQNSVAGSSGDGASCEKTSSSCPAADDCVHGDQNSSSRDVRSSPLMLSGSPLTPPRSQHSNDSLTSSFDQNSKNTFIDHTKMPCFMKNKGNNEAAKEQFQHINFDAKDVHDLAAEYENALNEGSFLAVHPSDDVKSDEITRVKSTSFFVTALIHDSDR